MSTESEGEVSSAVSVPAIAKGAPKPTAEDSQQSTFEYCAQFLPMKVQYLKAKNLVNGLNGMLLLGPSG